MRKPKFLVCTMYSGELDLPYCIKSIAEQKDVDIEHRLISFKDNLTAHNEVYEAFNNAPAGWIRAKIDADVVLDNDGIFKKIAHYMSNLTWFNVTVHDYFTDSIIHAGAAVYGDEVRFNKQENRLKADRDMCINGRQRQFGIIGKHAWYADERTAFYYGIIRGLKGQHDILKKVQRAYETHNDNIRMWALRGFELGFSERYDDWHTGRDLTIPSGDRGTYDVDFERLKNLEPSMEKS